MVLRMTPAKFLFAACLALTGAPPAAAQPVEVASLAAPDLFSTGGRETGLPPDLWRGASAETMRAVLPLLATKPLSPAAAGLARRVLATGANGPEGAGRDPALAGARTSALIALGDLEAASTILSRTAGVERDAALSRAAAEAALMSGDDARACAVADALALGREDVYWLRLRAFCQDKAGQSAAAQLTFDLAQAQARDAVFGRLMGAKLAGAGSPGAPSSRNGLDYALSRALGLTAAPPGAAIEAVSLSGLDDLPGLSQMVERVGAAADAKARARAQAAALLVAALNPPDTPEGRGLLAGLSAEAKAPAGREIAMDLASEGKLMGETALLALWTSAEAGAAGPAPGDRARIVRALKAVGLEADARAFAAEGLAALR
jgi:hypothetical protein